MTKVVTLQINERDVSGRDDESILDVALDNGIDIPTLCHLEGLTDVGACRLCLVEVKGVPKLLPACTTLVTEGMEVFTDSERLRNYRRLIIEMLFVEGNHICSICVVNGHCELQALAVELGVDHVELAYRYPTRAVDASHERFSFDFNRCVLCTRCVRVCTEVEGANTWGVMGRGITSKVITDQNQPWGESATCTSCGKCVQVCPVGALSVKGKSAGEMAKQPTFLPYLKKMRAKAR